MDYKFDPGGQKREKGSGKRDEGQEVPENLQGIGTRGSRDSGGGRGGSGGQAKRKKHNVGRW